MKVVVLIIPTLLACAEPQRNREDVTIRNNGVALKGTIVSRSCPRRCPAVVLLHGSGPDSRANPYYSEVTDAFVRKGFAVLTYDKRGTGESGGDWRTSDFRALVDDATAASLFLRRHRWVDSTRVGVWGGSEGGAIAPEVALRSRLVFAIMQSAPGVTFGRQNFVQTARQVEALTTDPAHRRDAAQLRLLLHAYVRDSTRRSDYERAARAAAGRPYADLVGPPRADWWWSWYRTKIDYTPIPALERLRAPVLAIWGSDDALLPISESRRAVAIARRPLKVAGDSLLVIDGADHSLYINGLKGVLRRGLRNRPVHLNVMAGWARRQVLRTDGAQ